MNSLKLKMINEILFEVDKNEISYDSLYFSCSVLIDKDHIHFSKDIFQSINEKGAHSSREGYAIQISTQLLGELSLPVVYLEMLSAVRRIDIEIFRNDMLAVIDKNLNKTLFFESFISKSTTTTSLVLNDIIYTNNSEMFPFGEAYPSELDDFIYKYDYNTIKKSIHPMFLAYMVTHIEKS